MEVVWQVFAANFLELNINKNKYVHVVIFFLNCLTYQYKFLNKNLSYKFVKC